MTAPWWAAFGPTETTVSCGGGGHLVRWAEGALHAVGHPDAEGELVLAALGGDATPCIDLVSAWSKHNNDLVALAIGPRAPGDELTLTEDALAEMRTFGSRPSWAGPPPRDGVAPGRQRPRGRRPVIDAFRAELLELLALGPAFEFRLCGAVAHAWSARGEHAGFGEAGPALTTALAGRAAPAVARWLGVDPGEADVGLHAGAGWGEVRLASAGGERPVQVRLPVSWLASVWAPGLANVGGCLVVGVIDAAFPVARVLTLTAPGTTTAELTVRHDGQQWTAA